MRAESARPTGWRMDPLPLSLDLHYMVTAWGTTSLDEQLTFAWTLRQMHEHPVLDASALSPEAGWTPDEVIQIVPAELTTEDMMRVWDGFEASYRLSSTYIARLVRLDPDHLVRRPAGLGGQRRGIEHRVLVHWSVAAKVSCSSSEVVPQAVTM